MVGNLEDRFSHNKAQILLKSTFRKYNKKVLCNFCDCLAIILNQSCLLREKASGRFNVLVVVYTLVYLQSVMSFFDLL